MIIIHGVGSFGHPPAKKYNLTEGMKTDEKKYGYCLMEAKNLELHYAIINTLVKNQVPAISLPPHSFVQTSAQIFSGFDLQIIQGYLEQGLIPVLHGDGVFDDQQGCSVLSGDIILPYLAKKLRAQQAIFLSDVDGVFDADPKKNHSAKLIPDINDSNFQKVLEGLTVNNENDVSGEMKGKVLEIRNRLKGLTVHIINGLKSKSLLKAVDGQAIGTQLLFR